jgi:hypothetical protein
MSAGPRLENFRVYTTLGKHVLHTPAGRGDAVRAHLLAQGIESEVSRGEPYYDRVEVGRGVSAKALQAILDQAVV